MPALTAEALKALESAKPIAADLLLEPVPELVAMLMPGWCP